MKDRPHCEQCYGALVISFRNNRLVLGLALLMFSSLACNDGAVSLTRDVASADLQPLRRDAGPADAVFTPWAQDGRGMPVIDYVVQGCVQQVGRQCRAILPASLSFSLLGNTNELTASWDFGDGSAQVFGTRVTHRYDRPGLYAIAVAAGEAGGTVSLQRAEAVSIVQATAGQACQADESCEFGRCLCRDNACGLAWYGGYCVQPCGVSAEGTTWPECAAHTVCVDLSLSESVSSEAWRQRSCFPVCGEDSDCNRVGFACRHVPGHHGQWVKACLPAALGGTGAKCRNELGQREGARCLGGLCLDLGVAGYCSTSCAGRGCAPDETCVRFTDDSAVAVSQPVCVLRCMAAVDERCNADPSLSCEPAQPQGRWGFTLNEAAPTESASSYCSAKRCLHDDDCGLGGQCDHAAGGFCRL